MRLKKVRHETRINRFFRYLKRDWPVFLALIYFIFPLDIIPDVIPVLGWVDDLLVLLIGFIVKSKNFNSRLLEIIRAVLRARSRSDIVKIFRKNGINNTSDRYRGDDKNEVIEGEIINE